MKSILLIVSLFTLLYFTSFAENRVTGNETYLTNNQYREFVAWVRDSIAKEVLSSYDLPTGKTPFSWHEAMRDSVTKEILEQNLFLSSSEAFGINTTQLDARRLIYSYETEGVNQSVPIYPDTLCWARQSVALDSVYPVKSYPGTLYDALSFVYFTDHWYDNSPVVGVSQEQLNAFVYWRETTVRTPIKAYLAKTTTKISIKGVAVNHWTITSSSYNRFLKYVADSLLLRQLGSFEDKYLVFNNQDSQDMFSQSIPMINWAQRANLYSAVTIKDTLVKSGISALYNCDTHLWNGNKLVYNFNYLNLSQASKLKNSYDSKLKQYTGTVELVDGTNQPMRSRSDVIVNSSVAVVTNQTDKTASSNWIDLNKFIPNVSALSYEQAYAFWNWDLQYECKKSAKQNPVSWYLFPTKTEWDSIKRTGKLPNEDLEIALPTEVVRIEK